MRGLRGEGAAGPLRRRRSGGPREALCELRALRRHRPLRSAHLGLRVPGEAARVLCQQRGGVGGPDRPGGGPRRPRLRALLERGGLRPPRGAADLRVGRHRTDQPLRREQSHGRAHARRRREGPRSALDRAALLQRLRRRSGRWDRRVPRAGDPPDPARPRGRSRPAKRAQPVRNRLPDPGRHLRP